MKYYSLIPELWLHYLWNANLITVPKKVLQDQTEVNILFKGWYNSGWGPDFSEAKIQVDSDILFGSVEIHINESDWFNHNHHQDDQYNNVILHVFVNASKTHAINQLQQIIHRFQIDLNQLESGLISQLKNLKKLEESAPGKCGIVLSNTKGHQFERLIQQAAEQRLIRKSIAFKELFINNDYKTWEARLYQSICKSLGYTTHAGVFEYLGTILKLLHQFENTG